MYSGLLVGVTKGNQNISGGHGYNGSSTCVVYNLDSCVLGVGKDTACRIDSCQTQDGDVIVTCLTFEMSDSESSEEEVDLNQPPRTWKQAVLVERVANLSNFTHIQGTQKTKD
jgi:hypothetical protein